MINLRDKYQTTHLSTRSMARQVFTEVMQLSASEQVLDFTSIEFASRSFMVQLYAMLAEHSAQVRLLNMNENVHKMYDLALRAWNRPKVLPSNMAKDATAEVIEL